MNRSVQFTAHFIWFQILIEVKKLGFPYHSEPPNFYYKKLWFIQLQPWLLIYSTDLIQTTMKPIFPRSRSMRNTLSSWSTRSGRRLSIVFRNQKRGLAAVYNDYDESTSDEDDENKELNKSSNNDRKYFETLIRVKINEVHSWVKSVWNQNIKILSKDQPNSEWISLINRLFDSISNG